MASMGDNVQAISVARHVRRLPAPGQAGVCRRRAAAARVADAGQLDQPGPAAAAGLLLLPARPGCGGDGDGPDRGRAERQLRQPDGGLDGQAHRVAGREVRGGDERQRRGAASICGPASYSRRASIRTVANAMDVGAPSNFERMQAMYGGSLDALRRDVVGRGLRRRAGRGGHRRRLPPPRLRARPAWRHRLAGDQRRAWRTLAHGPRGCFWPRPTRPSSARWSSRRSAGPCRCRMRWPTR